MTGARRGRTGGARWGAGLVAVVVGLSLAGCASEGPPDSAAGTGTATKTASSDASRGTTGPATDGGTARDRFPPRRGVVHVEPWHCGVELLGYPEGMWEARNPPFDATNAPRSFTGTGIGRMVAEDLMLYRDGGGQRIYFLPSDEVPPVVCD